MPEITWANVDTNPCRYMVLLAGCENEQYFCELFSTALKSFIQKASRCVQTISRILKSWVIRCEDLRIVLKYDKRMNEIIIDWHSRVKNLNDNIAPVGL